MVIDADGSVRETSVSESTLSNNRVEQCILEEVKRWRFEPLRAGGEITLHFPWIFRPPE